MSRKRAWRDVRLMGGVAVASCDFLSLLSSQNLFVSRVQPTDHHNNLFLGVISHLSLRCRALYKRISFSLRSAG
jgi:hypothetical protein